MPKKLITKHISDLTDEDKVQYVAYLKESFDANYGLDWDSLVPQIMEKIEFIFSHDDKTDPDPASIAARAYFRKHTPQQGQSQKQQRQQNQKNRQNQKNQNQEGEGQKPSLVDFMIFGSTFQKGIDEVSWWADVDDSTNSVSASVTASEVSATSAESSSSKAGSKTGSKTGTGQGGKERGQKGQSLLSPADKDLFYNTYFSLIDYVNRKYGIIRSLNVLEEQDSINPEELNVIASKLWANPKKEIDAYLAAKHITNHQESEAEELLQSWKRRIKGRFVIERYLKQGTIFISITEKNENEDAEDAGNVGDVYLVKGLSLGYESMFRNEKLPLMVDATLLPFKNVIITDGLVAPYGVRFIGKLKSAFKDVYLKAKHEDRIHTEL